MEFMTKMRFILLGIFFLFVSFSLAEERCDWYSLSSAVPEKIFYSKAYGNIPFLDDQKPGVYIVVHRTDLEVDVFVYLERSGVMHVYMEPGIPRNESTEDFYPCIDRHVKANLNHFKNTCMPKDSKIDAGVYDKIKDFLKSNPQDMESYCDCKKYYEVKLFYKEKNGNMTGVSFCNLHCLENDLQENVILEKYFSTDSLIETLLDETSIEKCNWRNLVKNPNQFASEIYRSKDYLLILSGRNCPAQ